MQSTKELQWKGHCIPHVYVNGKLVLAAESLPRLVQGIAVGRTHGAPARMRTAPVAHVAFIRIPAARVVKSVVMVMNYISTHTQAHTHKQE
jgi:hypothetical protein